MSKAAKHITELAIKNLRIEEGKRNARIYDGGGLFIYYKRRGAKTWHFRYKDISGDERWLILGEYPYMGIKAARTLAGETRNKILQGIDPKRDRELRKTQCIFQDAANQWLTHAGAAWAEKTRNIANTWLVDDVFPVIGHLPLDDVEAPDILKILRKVEAAGYDYKLRRLYGYLKRIFSYAISNGIAKQNPASALVLHDLFAPYEKKSRPAFIDPKEVAALMRMIEGYEGSAITCNALKLLPLVFARPGELTGMRWEDIDLDRKQWRYFVSKTKVDHVVPLSTQALAILDVMQPLTGRWEYVFPGERSRYRTMSNNTLNSALQYMGINTKTQHTAHGFRAMARTLLAEKGWNTEYIERQLCHRQPDDTVAAYAREKHLDKRTEMMQWWADYLDQLRDNL